jgi:hypothetical protein
MGPGLTKALETNADKIIQTIRFDGKNKNQTYSAFTAKLQQAFTDSNRADWTQERRVKVLLNAVTDSRLTFSVMHVGTHPTMQYNYNDASNYLQEVLLDKYGPGSENKGNRGVAAFDSGGRGRGRGGRGGRSGGRSGGRGRGRGGRGRGGKQQLTAFDPSKLDAYYSYSAYKNFTQEQKDMIRAAKDSKAKGDGNYARTNSQIASILSTQKETARQLAALTSTLDVAAAVNNMGTQSIGAAISGKRKRTMTPGAPTYQEVDGVMVRIT